MQDNSSTPNVLSNVGSHSSLLAKNFNYTNFNSSLNQMNQVKAKTNKKVVTLIKPKASTKTSVNMTKVTSEKKLKSKNK
jgi:hypothetical protein